MILYLHGFRSSPQSWKARLLGETLAARGLAGEYACPALSHEPNVAIAQAEAIIHTAKTAGKSVTLVGSSLGGFYASYLAETHDLRAVLINPAVLAPISLSRYIGTQQWMYSAATFEFTAEHVAQLEQLERAYMPHITPHRYLLLVEEGDEVLDYRHAVARYQGSEQVVLPGGDHSFTRYPDYVPQILHFAKM